MSRVAIVISEPFKGRINCELEGIPDDLPKDAMIGGPEFMELTVPQRFGLVLNEALKQTDLGKMVMGRCLKPSFARITIGGDDDSEDDLEPERASRYPCRCRIVDPTGEHKEIEGHEFVLNAPDVSKPKLGRTGWANLEPDGVNVRIKLDDGSELMGYQCWWEPIADVN